jgi:hypothetical protein
MILWADKLASLAGILAVLSLPFFVVSWIWFLLKIHSRRFPVISSCCFMFSTMIFITLCEFVTGYARGEVSTCLDALTKAEVTVNGQPARHPVRILGAIRSLHQVLGHHSSPTTAIDVTVRCHQGSVTLELGRDSQDPQEYWVYYPAHHNSAHNELGRIETSLFDGY